MTARLFPIILTIALHAVFGQTVFESYLPKSNVTGFAAEGNLIWFATYGQGIHEYDRAGNTWKAYSTQNKTAENDFFYCIALSPDYIFAGGSDGLYIYDRANKYWKKRKFAGGDYGNWVRALYYDAKTGILWIGRFINLTKFSTKTQKYEDINLMRDGDDRTNNFRLIAPDGDNLIYFGTEGGFYVLDKRSAEHDFTFYNSRVNGFPPEGEYVALSCLLSEKDFLWLGLQEFITEDKPSFNTGGLMRFNRRTQWMKFSRATGFPGNGIQALEKTGDWLWLSLYAFDKKLKKEDYLGLYLMNTSGRKTVKIDLNVLKMPTQRVQVLHFDGKYLWLGTDNGLWKILLSNPFAEWNKPMTKNRK